MPDPWDQLARWRDARSGETGDLWHRALIDPGLRRLVGGVRGKRLLDLACGNGYLARSFARQGASVVVGIDRSSRSIRCARARERRARTGVTFSVANATRLPFASGSFDVVVANMALMNIGDAAAATAEAARVLRPAGRFVFSISHPCFDIDERTVWSVEGGYGPDGIYHGTVYRKVRGYREERSSKVPWDVGQGNVVWTEAYHRTLATYAGYLHAAGLAISRLNEPAPGPEMIAESFQGPYLREIPLHLVVEAVPVGRPTPGSRTPARSRPASSRRSGSHARTSGTGSGRRGSRSGS